MAALAGTAVGDLFVFGDIRDALREGKRLAAGEQADYCTRTASRLARTYTDKHGLKDLARELLGVDMSKQQQSSDWGADTLSDAQLAYAASDVLHLHALKDKLDVMLAREGRASLPRPASGSCPIVPGSTLPAGRPRTYLPIRDGLAATGPYSQRIFNPLNRDMNRLGDVGAILGVFGN